MLGFRIWNGEKMIYPREDRELTGPVCSMFGNLLMWDISIKTMINETYNLIKPPEEYVAMQSTGETDMDNREIFLGDILWTGIGRPRYVVEKICGPGGFSDDLYSYGGDLELCEISIIGNIYENPELLEKV